MDLPLRYKELERKSRYIKQVLTLDDSPQILGHNHIKKFNLKEFLDQYFHIGFQATNLKIGIDIIKEARKNKATIFFGYTSNMITSGIRESIHYLAKNKLIDVLATTVGGIEEDMIKIFRPFVLGHFETPGNFLLEKGINRTGNIFVPNDRYYYFEKHFLPFLELVYQKQKERNKPFSSRETINFLGEYLSRFPKGKESVLYWAWKNKIPYFCPALTDGALGDMIYFFKKRNPDFYLDVTQDMKEIVDLALKAKKTAVIILGGGVVKHYLLNAQIFREGSDYAVYINTGEEFDGSDSGARPDEAVSWGKIKPEGKKVKIHADATLVFPLIVEGAFKEKV